MSTDQPYRYHVRPIGTAEEVDVTVEEADRHVTLSWSPVPGATGYDVRLGGALRRRRPTLRARARWAAWRVSDTVRSITNRITNR